MIARHSACVEHEFQDKQYGYKIRVLNETTKGTASSKQYSCTVCGLIFTPSSLDKSLAYHANRFDKNFITFT
jgi:hypothetical protein